MRRIPSACGQTRRVSTRACAFGDPLDTTDPSGEYVEGAYLNESNESQEREAVEREIAREAAARAAAEAAAAAAGPQYDGEEEWEEWGGYEYASETYGEGGSQVEPADLYQPLGKGTLGNEARNRESEGAETGSAAGSPHDQAEHWDVRGSAACFSKAGCRRRIQELRNDGSLT
jgi:hypothetical protein